MFSGGIERNQWHEVSEKEIVKSSKGYIIIT